MGRRAKTLIERQVDYIIDNKIPFQVLLKDKNGAFTREELIQIKERLIGRTLSYEQKTEIDPEHFPKTTTPLSFLNDNNTTMPGVDENSNENNEEEDEEEYGEMDRPVERNNKYLNFSTPTISEDESKSYKMRRFRNNIFYKIAFRLGFY